MSVTINREELLRQLDSVAPGLSKRELVEQSSCFVFQQGSVTTFNDEVACSHSCELNFEGAVQAAPLLNILRRLPDEDITIIQEESHLVVKGKRRKAGVRMESEILLDVKTLERPKKWSPLPSDFLEALELTQHTASKDTSSFALTCIHIHPKWIESTDKYQATRYRLATGFTEPALVRKDSVKELPSLGVTKISETPNWIHFKSKEGLMYSCRKHGVEGYPTLTKIFKFEGDPITLPKGLSEVAERAFVFSQESAQSTDIMMEIGENVMRIIGQGASGYFQERKKIAYTGTPYKFTVPAKLIGELSSKFSTCLINERMLMVNSGNWKYTTCLGSVDSKSEDSQDTPAE